MIRVGQWLSDERHRKGFTLEEVSKATKIKTTFLAYIEAGEYNLLPSSAYAQGFVKNYAAFLGLPVKETLAIFRREYAGEKVVSVLPESLAKRKYTVSRFRFQGLSLLLVVLFVTILFYLFFEYKSAFFPPPLAVVLPREGQTVHSQIVPVRGTTDINASVFINSDPVTIDKDGNFQKDVQVFSGKQTIIIRALNRFGKETSIKRTVTALGS